MLCELTCPQLQKIHSKPEVLSLAGETLQCSRCLIENHYLARTSKIEMSFIDMKSAVILIENRTCALNAQQASGIKLVCNTSDSKYGRSPNYLDYLEGRFELSKLLQDTYFEI